MQNLFIMIFTGKAFKISRAVDTGTYRPYFNQKPHIHIYLCIYVYRCLQVAQSVRYDCKLSSPCMGIQQSTTEDTANVPLSLKTVLPRLS